MVIGEIDFGADNVWSLQLPAGTADLPQMRVLAASLAPLNIYVSPEPLRFGGSDIVGLAHAGAPEVDLPRTPAAISTGTIRPRTPWTRSTRSS